MFRIGRAARKEFSELYEPYDLFDMIMIRIN